MKNAIRIAIAALVILALFVLLWPGAWPRDDADRIRAGFTAEFMERPDGYRGLIHAYGFEFPSPPRQLDPGLMYKACAEGAVDVISGFATDGRIAAYDLVTLEDDRNFFPPMKPLCWRARICSNGARKYAIRSPAFPGGWTTTRCAG